MAKQLNQQQVINLAFTADASQAKAELKQLQNSLQNLVNSTALNSTSMNFTKDIQQASAAAAQLKVQLQAATNVNTGNLDLTKFQDQLNKSGMSLEKYQNALFQLGPAGEKAFADLSRSITLAEVPLKRTNTLVSNLWVTLKNTARWQLSSSMLHGFMGTVQSAYGYAQDLNESLNNIRIVTGQNTDQMARFASEANKAAKALSTTTTAYTDAALIYYQQGLNDTQVKERTDITIKMANVSRQSAEEVSDQLTAVWNNFAKGGESLEHFADVMTRLGADTASSSDEIAQGLEKFSAVADMIGLSFDNAAAALATVTATTRQSADVVGTAFKTIFARIQGLSLGETLDDGTNLNKYSKALNAVGINIKEQNGELKDMDSILAEMGAKWNTLSKDQQVALAQTVAGVRQYNQLIALMDNFDFYQQNLSAAQNSDGSLQEQADIYAESWEAAQKRVKAAAESVYDAILNDKFFIDLNNNFAKLLDGVKTFIDGMGGVQGVLLSLGAIVTRVFQKQIAESLSNAAFSLKMMTKSGQEAQLAQKQKANDLLIEGARDLGTTSGGYKTEVYEALAKNQLNYIENSKRMTQEEQAINQMLMDRNRLLADEVIKKGESVQKCNEEIAVERKHLAIQAQIAAQNNTQKGHGNASQLAESVKKNQAAVENVTKSYKVLETVSSRLELAKGIMAGSEEFDNLKTHIQNVIKELAQVDSLDTDADFKKLGDAIGVTGKQARQLWEELNKTSSVEKLDAALTNMATAAGTKSQEAITGLRNALINCTGDIDKADTLLEDYLATLDRFGAESVEASEALQKLKQAVAEHNAEMVKAQAKPLAFSTAVTQAASALMAMGQIFNQIKGIIDVFNDSEATAGDKILALVTGIGMLIPAVMSIVPAFSKAKIAMAEFGITSKLAMWELTLIIVAITGLVAAIVLVKNAIDKASPEAKLKKAEENAKALSESLNEAKSQAQELKSVFDDYQGIVDKLKNCTKGTQEWKDALEEANAKTSELLAQYPELLSKANLFDENGILNVEVLQEALDNANEAVTALNAATLMAQADVQQAKVDVAKKDFAQDNEKYIIHTSNGSKYNYGAANKDLETLLSSYKTIGNSSLELSDAYAVLNINMDDATESEQKLANSLLNLANQSIAAANAVDNASISVINSWAKDQNIELEVGQSALMSDAYNETYESVSKAVKAASDTNNKANDKDYSKLSGDLFEGTSFEGMSVSDAFNQARGTNYNLARNGVRGTDDNRTYAYLENGEEKEYTIEEMQATIAASVALEKMGVAADAASASLSALDDNVGEGIGDGIKNWLASGNFESMNKADFDKMTEGIAQDENGNYDKTALEEYLKQAFNTDDVAGLLGDDWYDRFNSAAQNFSTALDNITANMSENAEKAYQSISNLEDLTLGDQKTLANLVQDAYTNNGTEGANALVEQINNAFANGAKIEDVTEFTNVISNIDWSTASIADFRNALNNAGIDVAALGIDIDTIFEAMAEGGSKSLSSIQENYKKIQDIVKDLQSGDTVSDEDYNTLVSQLGADAVDGYFSVMADGTHRLVGDAEDFYRAITENSRQQMLSNIFNANNLSSSLEQTSAGQMNGGAISTQDTSAAAVAYLQTLQLTEEETAKLAEIQDAYNQTGSYTAENMAKLDELMANHQITEEQFGELIEQNNIALRENSEALLSSATSLSELDGLAAQVAETSGGAVYGYAEALIGLASQYDNCTQEIEAYQQALTSGNEVTIAAAQDSLRAAVTIGELSEKYNLVAEDVETQAKLLKENRKELDLTEEEAARLAIANQRMNRGVETLNKNFKDWKKVLNSTDHTAQDYAETLNDALDALADLTGAADAASIPLDFLDNTTADGAKHLQWMEKAANGDVQAINLLGSALAIASVNAMQLDESFSSAFADATNTNIDNVGNKFNELQGIVSGAMNEIHNAIQSGMSVEEIQNKINNMGTGWVDSLNQMAIATGMSVDQMNSLLNQLGVQAQVEVTDVPQKMKVPTYTEIKEPTSPVTVYETQSDGTSRPITKYGWRSYTVPGPSVEVDGVVQVAQISTEGNSMSPAIKYTGTGGSNRGGGVSPSSTSGKGGGKGGGGGSSKKSEGRPKKTDVVDRYKEVEDKIDDIKNSADKASSAMDRLFGAKKIKKMQEVNKLLENEVDLLKAKRDEASKYLAEDEANLKQVVAKYGGSVKNVELVNGNIDNYDEILSALFNELYTATPEEGAEISDAQQEKIDAIQKRIDKVKEAISQYDETRELIEDLDNEIQDKLYEIQDRNFEILNYQLELKVEVDEAALKRLEYFLNKFSDDFYKMAESAALMNKQIPTYKSLIGSYDEYKTSLDTAYSKGKISQADYIEGLKQVRDGIYEQLEALNDLDKQMLHYYEDTLSAATDELADHTDHMEHLTSVFEHYQNLLSIIGKSKDYEAMGNFLQGQADTIKDRLSVAQSYYDVLLQQKDEIQAELQAAIASGDQAAIEMYQKEWDAIVDETDAAQEEVLSLTEEWAEAMKSVIQNNMEKIADTLEKTLTGGTTFDTLMDGFDKLNTRQEEYLTKTNQIYETNKLMRTASKALDETDNKVAKQKLKNFIDETKGLQETTQLSKYELEIQQAKYDLLLAQIALEEAQNAKSTVRLSRDSEGNFGYVYTADQNKIDDAQQAVDDADNSLYNLSLEGQQQYTEKYLQAQQSMYEELKQLQQDYLDGNIASEEEYERIKEQILNHYLGPDGVLTTYQNLYNVAVRTDANATADYWGQEYGRMTQDTEAWKTAVNDYLLEIDDQINEWKNVQTIANQEVEGALSNSKKATEELTEESEKLKDTINDEVIPTISDEIDAVKEQTDAYAAQRAELQALINTYENYLNALDATISANSIGFDKNTDYSALINEYLNSGGKTSDKAFQDLLKQRNAKIEWLESDAGGNKGSEYWGTKGADTLAYYETLTSGGGSEEQRAWFEKDYMTKDEMLDKLNNLGISTEELELAINEVKASTDTVGEKITETGNNTNTKLEEVGNNTNSKIEETNNNTNSKIDETKDNLNTSINDSKDTLNTSIESNRDETVTSLGDINNTIENRSDEIIGSIGDAASDIIGSIGSAASEISSSVGGAISSIRSEISSLRGSVTGTTIGSIAGPIGTAIGGVIGGAIGKAKRYDTGGYTGDWGPEGKLAILDQKELVLNQNDTQNLLSTVSLIRELVSMIDAQAANASLFNLMSSPSPNPNMNTLEQKVEITAEFPNVNDRYEIEEAFNNLVNRASQYANKAF